MQVPVRIPFPFFSGLLHPCCDKSYLSLFTQTIARRTIISENGRGNPDQASRIVCPLCEAPRFPAFRACLDRIRISSRHPFCRSFAPALTSWLFAEPAGVYRHL